MTSPAFLPPASGGVLVASPSAQVRDRVLQKLKPQRGPVHVASGGAEALAKLETGNWQMLFLDRELPDLDAEELVEIIERRYPGIRVVLMDSGLDDSAKLPGRANDWKPDVSPPACAMPSLVESKSEPLPGMVGDAEPMRRVYRMVRLVAPEHDCADHRPDRQWQRAGGAGHSSTERKDCEPFFGAELRRHSGKAGRV